MTCPETVLEATAKAGKCHRLIPRYLIRSAYYLFIHFIARGVRVQYPDGDFNKSMRCARLRAI